MRDFLKNQAYSLILIIISLSLLVWFLNVARFGFDFTDEGHYLNSISRPFHYDVFLPPSLFGFFIFPIYNFLGQDVVLLRQVGVLITYLLSWALTLSVIYVFWLPKRVDRLAAWAVAAAVACLSLVYYSFAIITPSYNLLAFHALMLIGLGAIFARHGARVFAWLLIGFGGWLLFVAKPSSAAAISLLLPICLIGVGAFRLRGVIFAGLTTVALLLASALVIDGSPAGLIARFTKSIELLEVLAAGHQIESIFRLGQLSLTETDWMITGVWITGIFALAFVGWSRRSEAKYLRISVCIFITGYIFSYISLNFSIAQMAKDIHLFTISVVIILAAIIHLCVRRPKRWADIRIVAVFCIFFVALPHAHIFGSNNDYWIIGAKVGFFWVLAAIAALGAVFQTRPQIAIASLAPAALVFPVLTITLLDSGIQNPYRQPPDLLTYSTAYDLADGGTVIVDTQVADYLGSAAQSAQAAGLSPGTPVIDLTGGSPGLLFALGLDSVGLPWLAGGYAGSDALAEEVYALETCASISGAWILDEPAGARRISPSTLNQFGADLDRDFALVGAFLGPMAGTGGPNENQRKVFLKPARDLESARRACEAARTTARD